MLLNTVDPSQNHSGVTTWDGRNVQERDEGLGDDRAIQGIHPRRHSRN